MNVAQWDAQWTEQELQSILKGFADKTEKEMFETKHRCQDGHVIDVEISASLVEVDNRKLIYASSRDITKRKEQEQSLRKSRANLRAVLDTSPFLIWQKDESGRYITVNQPLILAAGKKQRDELIGKTDYDLWPHELAEHYRVDDAEVMATQQKKYIEEKAVESEREYWVETHKAPIIDDYGQVIGTTGFARDITERKQAEEKIRLSEEKLRTLFEMSPLGIARNSMDGHFIEANHALLQITGYSLDELQQLSYWNLTPHEYEAQEALQLESLRDHGRYGPYEKEYLHKDGHRIPVRLNGVGIIGNDGEKYIWSIIEDITQQKQFEKELKEGEFRWKFALEGSGEGVWDWDIQSGKVQLSKRYKEIYGYEENEMSDSPDEWEKHVHPEDKPRVMAAMQAYFDGEAKLFSAEYRVLCKDGSWKWIHDRGMVVNRGTDGKPLRMIGTHIDITERIQLQQELERQAHVDYLTGLSNRRYFLEQAEVELNRSQRFPRPLSVFMLDIDHFKSINDTYGHQTGDLVLKTLAATCRTTLRDIDIVGRLGGEEFAILLPETGLDKAPEVAERLLKSIAKAKVQPESGIPLTFTVSIGVTTIPLGTPINIDTLLHQADQALYQAKNSGRNQLRVYENE